MILGRESLLRDLRLLFTYLLRDWLTITFKASSYNGLGSANYTMDYYITWIFLNASC